MNIRRILVAWCFLWAAACSPPPPNLGLGDDNSSDGGNPNDGGSPNDGGNTSGHGCVTSTDCLQVAGYQVCDVVAHQCVECLTNSQCPTDETCEHDENCHGTMTCTSSNTCNNAQTCGADGTCEITPGRCETSQDCITQLDKICNTSELACVQCLLDSDCGANGAATCTTMNTCQVAQGRCISNANCTSTPATPVCDTSDGFCIACMQNSDCPSEDCEGGTCAPLGQCTSDTNCVNDTGKTHCDNDTDQCVQCTMTSQCPSGHACTNNACISTGCTSGSCSGNTPVCNTQTGACVQCTSAQNCQTGQTCTSNVCVGTTQSCTNTDCNGADCSLSSETCNASTCTCQSTTSSCTLEDTSCGGVNCGNTPGYFCNPTTCTCQSCTDTDCNGVDCSSSSETCNVSETAACGCVTGVAQTTCAAAITCNENCGATSPDSACLQNCANDGNATAMADYDAVLSCIFTSACDANAGSGTACDSTSANYNATTCNACVQCAIAGTTGTACTGDTAITVSCLTVWNTCEAN